ncbi:MAG: hypothetical protein GF350_00140, partial [Chitinivibrionales bacterium]|nr:hypothetical protein [Chitinivibrionales bacterium]
MSDRECSMMLTIEPDNTTSHRKPDSLRVQDAIDACSSHGGGTVFITAGTYRCGTIELKSHVQLYLHHGAHVKAINEPNHFPVIGKSPDPILENTQTLLYARNATNIAIAGSGIFDGDSDIPLQGIETAYKEQFRPAMLYFENCRNIMIRDARFVNSNFWGIHLKKCEDARICGAVVKSN